MSTVEKKPETLGERLVWTMEKTLEEEKASGKGRFPYTFIRCKLEDIRQGRLTAVDKKTQKLINDHYYGSRFSEKPDPNNDLTLLAGEHPRSTYFYQERPPCSQGGNKIFRYVLETNGERATPVALTCSKIPEKHNPPKMLPILSTALTEARIHERRLDHPNIQKSIDLFHIPDSGDSFFPCTQFIISPARGCDLKFCRERYPLPSREVTNNWIRGMQAGMEYLHGKNLSHGDLKPGNMLVGEQIVLTRHPEQIAKLKDIPLRIADFGSVTIYDPEKDTLSYYENKTTVGFSSPEYASNPTPKQLYRSPQATIRADFFEILKGSDRWALAVSVYRMLCLQKPYNIPPNREGKANSHAEEEYMKEQRDTYFNGWHLRDLFEEDANTLSKITETFFKNRSDRSRSTKARPPSSFRRSLSILL